MSEFGALFVSARKHYKLPAPQRQRPTSQYWKKMENTDENPHPALHHRPVHNPHRPCCAHDASNTGPSPAQCEDNDDFTARVSRKADRQASVSSTSTVYTTATETTASSATDLTTDEETSDKEDDAIFSPVDSETVTPAESVPVSPAMKIELDNLDVAENEISGIELLTPTPVDKKLVEDATFAHTVPVEPTSAGPESFDATDLFPTYTFTPAIIKQDTFHLPTASSTPIVLTVVVTDLEPGDRPYYPYLGGVDLSYKACKQYERDGQQKLWPYWKPNGGMMGWETSDAGDAAAFKGVIVGWEKEEDEDEEEDEENHGWDSSEEEDSDEEEHAEWESEEEEDEQEYDTGDIEVVFG